MQYFSHITEVIISKTSKTTNKHRTLKFLKSLFHYWIMSEMIKKKKNVQKDDHVFTKLHILKKKWWRNQLFESNA